MLENLGAIKTALDIIKSGIDIAGRKKAKKKPQLDNNSTLLVAKRFVELFESHGVKRTQIPKFFGHDLTLEKLKDDETLLSNLSDEMLDDVCELFAVRREWLDGVEEQIHPYYDFYKNPEKFSIFIEDLVFENPDSHLFGVVIAPSDYDWTSQALIILQERVGTLGEKEIFRYHLCNNWAHTYWKARAYLTACVAIGWKRNIYIHGIHKPKGFIKQLAFGETLLGWKGEGIWELGHKTWDPEDMALRPEAFLNEVDAEKDDFGIKSGLRLWLDLDECGLMDTGLPVPARALFEKELRRFNECQ
ncbi:hypothetical protein ACFL2V_19205 [Pseudomonadota bacterium]